MAIPVLSEWCASCDLVEIPTNDVFKALAVQYFCSGGGGGGGSGIVVTENCLIVTSDGAWGSEGQVIDEYVFFNTAVDPPVETARLWYNRALVAYVTGIDSSNSEACPDELFGSSCDTPLYQSTCFEPAIEATLTSTLETSAGTITAQKYSVSIDNIGNAAGEVDGITLPAGRSVTFNAYHVEPGSGTAGRDLVLPDITFDATGTQFVIRVLG